MPDLKRLHGKQGKYVTRFVPRRPGDDDSRIATPPAGARICPGPAHPATVKQPPPGRGGVALSGPAAIVEGETCPGGVDRFVHNESSRAHIPNHQDWLTPPGA